jgi:hypothetical protein
VEYAQQVHSSNSEIIVTRVGVVIKSRRVPGTTENQSDMHACTCVVSNKATITTQHREKGRKLVSHEANENLAWM